MYLFINVILFSIGFFVSGTGNFLVGRGHLGMQRKFEGVLTSTIGGGDKTNLSEQSLRYIPCMRLKVGGLQGWV